MACAVALGASRAADFTVSAGSPVTVTVVITNGAKWVTKHAQTMTSTGKGGTIVASAPTVMHGFGWGIQVPMPVGNAYTNGLVIVGWYADVVVDAANFSSICGTVIIFR